MNSLHSIFMLLIVICNSYISNGQVEGIVLDSMTGEPVEYVNVFVRNQMKGTLTDSLGTFLLYLKANSDSSDKITFSRIGYVDQEITIQSFSKSVLLIQKPESAQAIVVAGKEPRDTLVGFTEDQLEESRIHGYINSAGIKHRHWINNHANELALRINIPTDINYVKIKNVSFYLPRIGKPKTPFRLKLYNIDKETGEPSDYITEDNLILRSNVKEGWFDIDLEMYNVYVKGSGFYISMEWLGNSKRKYWSNKDLSKNKSMSEETKRYGKIPMFGQILGMYDAVEANTASRFSFKPWSMHKPKRHPMVRAILSIAE